MLIQTDEIKNQQIKLRRQANFWKAQHHRSAEREVAAKDKIFQLRKTLREQYAFNEQLIKENELLKGRIAWLEQQLFGRKSEKSSPSTAGQNSSLNAEAPTNSPQSTQPKRRKRGKQKGAKGYGRKRREELPCEEIFVDIPEELLQCSFCGKYASEFPGTEDSELIDWQIALIRLIYRRKRYYRACNCQNFPRIFSAPPVPKLIPKGMFSCNFWTQLLIEKFLFQRPLYRIRRGFLLEGLDVSGGTFTGGLKRIAELIRPLYAMTIERNRNAHHWKMDETRWMVYTEVAGKKGYKHWFK